MVAVVVLTLSVFLHGVFQTPALAQVQLQAPVQQEPLIDQPQAKPPIDGVPILLDGREVLTLRRGIAGFSLQERAETISRRLKRFAQDDSRSIDSLTFQQPVDDDFWYISAGQDVLLTINERDAQASSGFHAAAGPDAPAELAAPAEGGTSTEQGQRARDRCGHRPIEEADGGGCPAKN
ncbi:MAG: hypothetical protein NTW51_14635 [Cyanobacteria bacterium]|nr:hypothetical protein [Cyanobacteriota bacterium]